MTTQKNRVIYYFDGCAEIINGTFYDAVFTARERMDSNGHGYEIMMNFPWVLTVLFKFLLSKGYGESLFIKLARFDGRFFKTAITYFKEKTK